MKLIDGQKFYTKSELARLIGVPEGSIYNFSFIKKNTKKYYSESEKTQFISEIEQRRKIPKPVWIDGGTSC